MSQYHRWTEVRHMSNEHAKTLGKFLEPLDACEMFMKNIPREQDDKDSYGFVDMQILKYNNTQVDLLKEGSKDRPHYNMMQLLLLDEWGTSGKVRPKLGHLMRLLVQLQLYRAADYLAEEVLKEPLPERPLHGPAARVDLSLPTSEPSTFAATSGTSNQLPNGSNPTDYRNMNRAASKAGPSEMQKVHFQLTNSHKADHADVGDLNFPALSMLNQNSQMSDADKPSPPAEENSVHNTEESVVLSSADAPPESSRNIPVLSMLQQHSSSAAVNVVAPMISALLDQSPVVHLEESSDVVPDLSLLQAHQSLPSMQPTAEDRQNSADYHQRPYSGPLVSMLMESSSSSSSVSASSSSALNIPNISLLQNGNDCASNLEASAGSKD